MDEQLYSRWNHGCNYLSLSQAQLISAIPRGPYAHPFNSGTLILVAEPDLPMQNEIQLQHAQMNVTYTCISFNFYKEMQDSVPLIKCGIDVTPLKLMIIHNKETGLRNDDEHYTVQWILFQ